MRNWEYIIIHHSATIDSSAYSWDAIKKYHVEINKWSDIGYHGGIELVGEEYKLLAGRPLNMKGAHCKDGSMNDRALGFCFVGNYDIIEPTISMLIIASHQIKSWMDIFHIPVENIKGHRDYSIKSCPGSLFNLDLFREMLF